VKPKAPFVAARIQWLYSSAVAPARREEAVCAVHSANEEGLKYAWIGPDPVPQSLKAFLGELETAELYPGWLSFCETAAHCETPTLVFGPPQGVEALRRLDPPLPTVGVVVVGSPEELAGLRTRGPDAVIALPPTQRDMQFVHSLGERLRATKRLARNWKETRDFIEAAACDLRTAATCVVAYGELLLDQVPPAVRTDVNTLLQNASVIEELAARLLAYARSEIQGVPLRLAVLGVRSLLDQALGAAFHAAQERGVEVLTQYEPGVPPLWADPIAVKTILHNILDNAIRFSRPGGSVTISVTSSGDGVRFCFEDNGPGFSPEQLSGAFLRSKRSPGLGLAVAWELVQLHEGLIWAENREEGGARLAVVLPSVQREVCLLRYPGGSVTAAAQSDGVRISFEGVLGRQVVTPLRTALVAVTEQAPSVTIDLSRCVSLASGVIGLLVELALEHRVPCRLAGVSPELEPVLRAARLFEVVAPRSGS